MFIPCIPSLVCYLLKLKGAKERLLWKESLSEQMISFIG